MPCSARQSATSALQRANVYPVLPVLSDYSQITFGAQHMSISTHLNPPVKLTHLASCAGCAAKLAPNRLADVLRPLQNTFRAADYPALLVGLETPDDAAIYQVSEDQAIISTVDFFPPVVDDPYAFGAIAAANAMSDVYAMGGEVAFAINLVCFPENLDLGILTDILRGGADRVKAAGGAIAGGHTVKDDEPKYGLAVTGLIDPRRRLTKGGAQPGDKLYLTKRLGVGVITTALKREQADPAHAQTAIDSMMNLNRDAARVAVETGVHAMTDVTGFGLVGHGHEMAHYSGVDYRIDFDALPFLPGSLGYGERNIFPGGAFTNADYYRQWTHFAPRLTDWQQMMIFDPETSGGLLIAVSPDRASALESSFAAHQVSAWPIGEVIPGAGHLHID